MAPRTTLNDPEVICQAISEASGMLVRALAHCEDHDGAYRATFDQVDFVHFQEVSHHLSVAAEHLERAARFAASL